MVGFAISEKMALSYSGSSPDIVAGSQKAKCRLKYVMYTQHQKGNGAQV
jgi:hypothetical protein